MSDNQPTTMQELLNTLDVLTKDAHVVEWQGDGEARTIFKRTDPPLLDRLHAAIVSDTGGNGSGKAARERAPLDIGALQLFDSIDGRARAWLDEVGARPGKDVEVTQILQSWYVLWGASNPSDGLAGNYLNVLDGWVNAINDVLSPPKRIELTSKCPICNQEWVSVGLKMPNGDDDPNDAERVRVLVAVERESINESYATCKACSRVWKGVGAMRQLRILIDDMDAREAEESAAIA